MTVYRFVENAITKEEIENYSRIHHGTATGAKLIVSSEDGKCVTEYVVF